MTRSHRNIRRILWPALALAVVLGFAGALHFREPLQAAAPDSTAVLQP